MDPKQQNHTQTILRCPQCQTLLHVQEDTIHDETYCTRCGCVLRGPPYYGIVYPEVIREKKGSEEEQL